MSDSSKQEITLLLKNLRQGDKSKQDQIMKVLYKELRGFAGSILNKENQTITFQATELVNEAYIRMFDSAQLFVERNNSHVCKISCAASAPNNALFLGDVSDLPENELTTNIENVKGVTDKGVEFMRDSKLGNNLGIIGKFADRLLVIPNAVRNYDS